MTVVPTGNRECQSGTSHPLTSGRKLSSSAGVYLKLTSMELMATRAILLAVNKALHSATRFYQTENDDALSNRI